MWVPHTNQFSNSADTKWCPTIQFNSDTNYPELVSLEVKGSVLQDCPHFRCQLQVTGPPVLLTDQL